MLRRDRDNNLFSNGSVDFSSVCVLKDALFRTIFKPPSHDLRPVSKLIQFRKLYIMMDVMDSGEKPNIYSVEEIRNKKYYC